MTQLSFLGWTTPLIIYLINFIISTMKIWNYFLMNDTLNNKLKLPVGGGKCLND